MTEILPPTPASIARCVEALRRSDVVGMPTETVYGLAGGAFDGSALARIFAVKDRPFFDPLIAHVSPELLKGGLEEGLRRLGLTDLSRLSEGARTASEGLARAFWPGPLTLVVPKLPGVPDLLTSGLPTVAVRMPAHEVAQALLTAFGAPLAAPSANRFGRISPTSAEDVREELGGRIPYILDGGPCLVGVESTVVRVEDGGPGGSLLRILRPGRVAREELETVSGLRVVDGRADAASAEELPSPGLLDVHYAPSKPLHLVASPADADTLADRLAAERPAVVALLGFGEPAAIEARFRRSFPLGPVLTGTSLEVVTLVFTLADDGAMETAARNLFARLREADGSRAGLLVAEPPPGDEGLARAIRDRLARAAGGRGQ